MDKYLVIGNPIDHSLSPQIHTAFAKQTHQRLVYDRLCLEPKDFINTLDNFFASGGKGANITAPFKVMAFDYVKTRCSERGKLAKAVNTLAINPTDNCVYGDNTDGIGLLRDLKKHQFTLFQKKILILGAGGATQGILSSLLSENPTSITFYNRTQHHAHSLIQAFRPLDNLFLYADTTMFDLVINTIPSKSILEADCWSSLPSMITQDTYVYDLNYSQSSDSTTPFISKMLSLGCEHTLDGFGMLLEQAAESFFIWRRIYPTVEKLTKEVLKPTFFK